MARKPVRSAMMAAYALMTPTTWRGFSASTAARNFWPGLINRETLSSKFETRRKSKLKDSRFLWPRRQQQLDRIGCCIFRFLGFETYFEFRVLYFEFSRG